MSDGKKLFELVQPVVNADLSTQRKFLGIESTLPISPNTVSQVPVKWVAALNLHDEKWDGLNEVPVVELSALREVVEGLPDKFRQYEHTLLEAHAGMTEEQLCGAAIALHWVKKRLLASLGE